MDLEHIDLSGSGSSSDSGDNYKDRLAQVLASQKRLQHQLKRLSSGQKDVFRLLFDMHRVLAADEAGDDMRSQISSRFRPSLGKAVEKPRKSQTNLSRMSVQSFPELSNRYSTVVASHSDHYLSEGTLGDSYVWESQQYQSDGSSIGENSVQNEPSPQLGEADPQLGEADPQLGKASDGPRGFSKPVEVQIVDPPDDVPAGSDSHVSDHEGMDIYESNEVGKIHDLLAQTRATSLGKRASLGSIETVTLPRTNSENSNCGRTLLDLLNEHGSVFAGFNSYRQAQSQMWRPPPSLPQDWPGMLKPHTALCSKNKRRSENNRSLYLEDVRTVQGKDMLSIANPTRMRPEPTQRLAWCWHHLVMLPMSMRRIALDILGLTVLGYDLFMTPFVLAWDLPLVGIVRTFAWVSVSFWASDVLASFCTGYYRNGLLEIRPHKVIQRYLRSWFPLDMTIIICDLISLLSGEETASDSKAADLLRFSKLSRLIRIVSVLRLVRLADISVRLTDWGISQRWAMVADIAKLLLGILWISHAAACAWFTVGRHLASDTGARWVAVEAFPGKAYTDTTIEYQYSTSMHWVLAQITPGSMDVQPLNTVERIFNVICLLCGLFFFTSLISSLSTKMVHFRMMKQEEAMMFIRLRKYLQQESIAHQLAVTVQKQLRDRLQKQKMLTPEDVPEISLLSLGTRMEIHFQCCKPHLRNYTFFHLWANIDIISFRKFCYKAISFVFMPPGDVLFLPGSQAKEAYHLCDGRLTYQPEDNSKQRATEIMSSSAQLREFVHSRSGAADSTWGDAATRYLSIRSTKRATDRHPSERSEGGVLTRDRSRSTLRNGSNEKNDGIDDDTTYVEPGAWLCEGALWTQWIHVGTATAAHRCKLLTCNGAMFVKELMAHRLTRPIAVEYGLAYHSRLIQAFPPHSAAPDDLQVPQTSPEEIICCLEPDVRCFVSSIAFNTLGTASAWMNKGRLAAKCVEELGQEVLEGKTILMFDATHTVKRVVQLSIAVIRCDDGEQILVQLGREEMIGKKIRFSPVYPGIKQVGKDSPSETTYRLLETTLKPLLPGLTMEKTYLETEFKVSSRYNLQTKYLRTVQEMTMSTAFLKSRKRVTMVNVATSVPSATTSIVSVRKSSAVSGTASCEFTAGQMSSSMRNSLSSVDASEAKFLKRLRPRRVLQNVIGYAGEVDPVDIVEKLQMFILRDDDGSIVCAWMSLADFNVIAHPDNEAYLQHWFHDHVVLDT